MIIALFVIYFAVERCFCAGLLPVQRTLSKSLEDLALQKGLWLICRLIYILSSTFYVMRHRSLHVL